MAAGAAEEMIMDPARPLAASVDLLCAEFPAAPRREVEQVMAAAWSLFSSSDDGVLRLVATEWYARKELAVRYQSEGKRATG